MAASTFPAQDADEPYPIGSVLDGRYRIDGVLGTGGMGRVYRAEHVKIGRSVAIKVLHADTGRNREASQRFQREAIASGRLDHPNIVGVSDFGVLDGGTCYLVMELLEGESLGDRLGRDHRIHWTLAIDILRGVLCGLRHAHERGVVHRDIKPDNVFLAHKDGDPVVKILDFGIAKLYAGCEDDPASTRAGLTVGTPAYLSPEQAVGGAITPASDLYSSSIVLYEMIAGRAPFEDKDPLAMLGAHVSRRPPAFADIAPGVEMPPALEDIIQRGLVKTPADRIATATDYLALLDAFCPPVLPLRSGAFPAWLDRVDRSDGARRSQERVAAPVVEARTAAPVAPAADPVAPAPAGSATATSGRVEPPAPEMSEAQLPASPPASAASAPPDGADVDARAVTALSATATHPAASPRSAAASAPAVSELPPAARAVSLADLEPIPLSWIVRSGVIIALVILAATALALTAHCTGSEIGARPAAGSANAHK